MKELFRALLRTFNENLRKGAVGNRRLVFETTYFPAGFASFWKLKTRSKAL
jgi:hypothetical protein